MKDPYRIMWAWANHSNFNTGQWSFGVKWTGTAFYVGSNADHITITEGADGFHHTVRSNTGVQHSAATLDDICAHIRYNGRRFYPNGAAMIRALEYIRDHAPNF